MRQTILFVFILSLIGAGRSASAGLLVYDGFDYPDASQLNGKTNPMTGDSWTKPATPAGSSATATIKNDNLSYPGLEDSTGLSFGLPRSTQSNVTKIAVPGAPYNPNTETKSVFFSFLMKMTSFNTTISDAVAATQTHRDGDFIAGFTSIVGGGGTTNMSGANVYAGQVRIRRALVAGTQNGTYQLGFHKNNSGGAGNWAPTYAPDQFAPGETVFVVGEYQFGTTANNDDVVRMWLNPTPGQPGGAPDITSNFGLDVHLTPSLNQASITSFWFRDGNTFLPGPVEVDELRIGTTYKSVTPAPEPGSLLIASGLALLGYGALRRR